MPLEPRPLTLCSHTCKTERWALSMALNRASACSPPCAGWYGAAPWLGGYGRAAQGGGLGAAAGAAAKCWAVGVPVGLLLRTLSRGYLPETPFLVVSMVATAVLLVGWRSALAAATPEAAPKSPREQLQRRKNKQGNPFEFVSLLFGLVKRW